METITAFDLARGRMARLTSGRCTGSVELFGSEMPQGGIQGPHSFGGEMYQVFAQDRVTVPARAVDHILFLVEGRAEISQGGQTTACSRWDCIALAAGAPVSIAAVGSDMARLLHLVPTAASYAQAGRQPSVAGPFDHTRVARWGQVKGYDDAFVTSTTPGLEKRVFKLLNRGISVSGHIQPALPHEFPFTMSIIEMEPDKGATLHAHATEEMFIALDGDLDLVWTSHGERRMRLSQGELVSMPTDVMRGFRNLNGRQFHMLAIVGGWNRQSVDSVTYGSADYQPVSLGPAATV